MWNRHVDVHESCCVSVSVDPKRYISDEQHPTIGLFLSKWMYCLPFSVASRSGAQEGRVVSDQMQHPSCFCFVSEILTLLHYVVRRQEAKYWSTVAGSRYSVELLTHKVTFFSLVLSELLSCNSCRWLRDLISNRFRIQPQNEFSQMFHLCVSASVSPCVLCNSRSDAAAERCRPMRGEHL